MGIADSMQNIAENIVSSYNVRVRTLGELVEDTNKTLQKFASNREKMAREQRETLTNFVNDLTRNVGNMLKMFHNNHKEMSTAQAKDLRDFVNDLTKNVSSMLGGFQKEHSKMSEELRDKLATSVKKIETYVKNKLKEFHGAHADMSEELKKDLAKYVNDIASSVKKLLGEYGTDMKTARDAWQNMSSTLAKARRKGVMPRIEAKERVTTLEEAMEGAGEEEAERFIEKIVKPKKRRKRGRR